MNYEQLGQDRTPQYRARYEYTDLPGINTQQALDTEQRRFESRLQSVVSRASDPVAAVSRYLSSTLSSVRQALTWIKGVRSQGISRYTPSVAQELSFMVGQAIAQRNALASIPPDIVAEADARSPKLAQIDQILDQVIDLSREVASWSTRQGSQWLNQVQQQRSLIIAQKSPDAAIKAAAAAFRTPSSTILSIYRTGGPWTEAHVARAMKALRKIEEILAPLEGIDDPMVEHLRTAYRGLKETVGKIGMDIVRQKVQPQYAQASPPPQQAAAAAPAAPPPSGDGLPKWVVPTIIGAGVGALALLG